MTRQGIALAWVCPIAIVVIIVLAFCLAVTSADLRYERRRYDGMWEDNLKQHREWLRVTDQRNEAEALLRKLSKTMNRTLRNRLAEGVERLGKALRSPEAKALAKTVVLTKEPKPRRRKCR